MTASTEYAAQQKAIRAALHEIRVLLRAHAGAQKANPLDYGYAGSLAHVAHELRDIAGFLAGGKA